MFGLLLRGAHFKLSVNLRSTVESKRMGLRHRRVKMSSGEKRHTHIIKNPKLKQTLTKFSMDNWKVVICLMISLSRFTSLTHCAKSWQHKIDKLIEHR